MNQGQPPESLIDALSEPEQDAPLPPNAEARLQAFLRRRVVTMAAERRRARQRRRIVMASVGLTAAAAAVALMVQQGDPGGATAPMAADTPLWRAQPASGATLTWFDPQGQVHQLHDVGALQAPDRVQTDGRSAAKLTTPDGVVLSLAPNTALGTTEAPDRRRAEVRLDRGEVMVNVPKLGPERVFAVRTHDSEVIVHGTRFQVRLVGQDAQRHTCVRVEEGKVEVRNPDGTFFIGPGEAVGCEREPASPRAKQRPARTPEGRRGAVKASARHVEPSAPASDQAAPLGTGTLAAENRLLSEALAAERKGDLGEAARAFEELLRRHPESPLGPEARRGLSRIRGQRSR